MLRLLLAFTVLWISTHAVACVPPYRQFEIQFEGWSQEIPVSQVRRAVEWRDKTRAYYPAGFLAFIALWENGNAEISHEIALKRAENLRTLLLNLGVPSEDIRAIDIRKSNRSIETAEELDFLNTSRVDIDARCPHLCCRTSEL